MKDVSKTLSIAAVVAMVSAAGVTIAQTSQVPNSNSPNTASAPYATSDAHNREDNTALPTSEGSTSATQNGAAATPTLEERQEGSGSVGSRNTPDATTPSSSSSTMDSSTSSSTTDSGSTSSSTTDSGRSSALPADSSSSELPARADRG
ncbi:hypothetical protein [Piscinibacter sp. HJYY11]|uniref:hypothetical protein n=1 Tax=Piscinibacter sp. HJYY11 TaxID=2801333 RepID=UPI00191E9BFB|nr:hypothetical protein [Piscinibacter sp. HJYY11]MBL0726362.1 hypothetical protein [Piscinibacter sp. HJYY11]